MLNLLYHLYEKRVGHLLTSQTENGGAKISV